MAASFPLPILQNLWYLWQLWVLGRFITGRFITGLFITGRFITVDGSSLDGSSLVCSSLRTVHHCGRYITGRFITGWFLIADGSSLWTVHHWTVHHRMVHSLWTVHHRTVQWWNGSNSLIQFFLFLKRRRQIFFKNFKKTEDLFYTYFISSFSFLRVGIKATTVPTRSAPMLHLCLWTRSPQWSTVMNRPQWWTVQWWTVQWWTVHSDEQSAMINSPVMNCPVMNRPQWWTVQWWAVRWWTVQWWNVHVPNYEQMSTKCSGVILLSRWRKIWEKVKMSPPPGSGWQSGVDQWRKTSVRQQVPPTGSLFVSSY